MRRFLALALFVLALAAALPCAAQEGPLTQPELDRFLKDFPPTAKYMESIGNQLDAQGDPGAWAQSRAAKEFRDFVGKRGWTAERFSLVAAKVSSGIVAQQMSEMGPQIQAEYENARREIMANPELSPEQKKQLLAQMEQGLSQSMAAGKSMPLTPGETALIRANKDRIIKAFEME